jgi:hypothetical protein
MVSCGHAQNRSLENTREAVQAARHGNIPAQLKDRRLAGLGRRLLAEQTLQRLDVILEPCASRQPWMRSYLTMALNIDRKKIQQSLELARRYLMVLQTF